MNTAQKLNSSTSTAITANRCYTQPFLDVYLSDCLDKMRDFEDKQFDLAIVDVPYGIGEDGSKNHTRGKLAKPQDYKPYAGNDKNAPVMEYFEELQRISKNQIIFGANHFIQTMAAAGYYINSSCWIVWDKDNTGDFADCELAWTSFNTAVRKFKFRWNGMLQGNMKDKQIRIHPTEKPIALYSWLIQKYAKQGDKILDTHLGSGSIALAIDKANKLDGMDLSFVGIELDKDYFDAAINRFKDNSRQTAFNFE